MQEREIDSVMPEGVAEALQALADADAHLSAPPRVEAALVAAFREQKARRRLVRMRPRVSAWAAVAAAAVLVLAAVRIAFVRPAAPAPVAQTEIATPYFPLVPGFDPETAVSDPAVRVEMPRTVLAAYGLPVNVERIDVPIQADLLIGDDGTARAIRFVAAPAD